MSTKSWLPLTLLAAAIGGGVWWSQRVPAAAGAGAAAATAPASGASGNALRQQTVGVIAARMQDVPVQIDASGTVTPLKSVDLRAQVTGTVQEVLIRDGQDVKAGQVLFKFDDRADRANIEKARAQLLRDRATLADQERQLARAQELRAQNFIAQSAVDTVQAQVDAQKALVASDLAALKSTEVNLSYSTVRAQLSGRAGLVSVNAGSLVQPSATAPALVTISQIDPIGVTFTIPEGQLTALQQAAGGRGRAADAATGASAPAAGAGKQGGAPDASQIGKPDGPPTRAGAGGKGSPAAGGGSGLKAFVSLPGSPRGAAADAAAPVEGRVTFIDNAVDTTTGTIRVRAEFPNAERQLWPGQYVRVKLTLRTLKDAVVIPQAAIIMRGQERSVYVVGDDNIAQLRPVQTRQPMGELVVAEGVQAGEKIVVDGKQNLRPGNPVKAVPAQLDPAGGRRRPAADAASGPASGSASGPESRSAAASAPEHAGSGGSGARP